MTGSNQVSNVVSSVVTPVALSGVKTPLLNQFEGAAAAYSLRRLKSWDDGSRVVRVRRESDNTERDFSSVEVSDGTMARWVNEQPTLPLDLRELDTNTGERDGALIEAAAAYSLRKLKEDFTGDVVEVRRNVDGETEGFTAAEVTDGTLESFVNASFDEELPLDQATGAAAAYSLRNLSSSFTGDVVEVRRSSDDAAQSFTASEVADGTLEDWVNAVGVARNRTSAARWNSFTATSTGFEAETSYAAACGFDLVGSSGISFQVSFDVVINSGSFRVELRNGFESGSLVSNSETINSSGSKSFTLTATSDFVALQFISTSADIEITNFSIDIPWTYDGYVRTWYDQSGSDNDAVQTTPANQPKIVEGGNLVTDGGLPALSLDGTNHSFTVPTYSATGTLFFAAHPVAGVRSYPILIGDVLTGSGASLQYWAMRKTGDASVIIDSTTDYGTPAIATYKTIVNDASFWLNGNLVGSDTSTNEFTNDGQLFGPGNAQHFAGKVFELIIYNSDQSTKRRAIEENIANHYDISLAAFSRDGTVSTWYDQSETSGVPNANHAVQTDTTKQPDIVVNGNLLEDGIKFDGTDDFLSINFGAALSQPNSIFMVHTSDTATDSKNEFFDTADGTPRTLLDQSGSYYRMFAGSDQPTSLTIDANQKTLVGAFYNTTSSFLSKNGTVSSTLSVGTSSIDDTSNIGYSALGGRYYDGSMDEFIIYNSDQSDNRTAIEANIGETYGITAIPAANDTVNGYVQTWYDQSGNGNDAEQSAASSQPKIVGEVTSGQPHAFLGAVVFDGTDDFLSSNHILSQDDLLAVHAVAKLNNNTNRQRLVGNTFYVSTSNNGGFNLENKVFNSTALAATLDDLSVSTYTIGSPSDIDTSNEQLFTLELASGTLKLYTDGTELDSVSAQMNAEDGGGKLSIGAASNGASPLNGTMKEIVIYNSDQSSNRPAIETNIINHYDI